MARNTQLTAEMANRGMTQRDLAKRMNEALEDLTGRCGTVGERTIHRYVTGQTRKPHRHHIVALETVFGCPARDLGFTPPAETAQRNDPALPLAEHHQEDDMRRRALFLATATTALTASGISATPASARTTVGTSDVAHVRDQLARLWLVDDSEGGGPSLEERAMSVRQHAIVLQEKSSATQRVRSRLYALAAAAGATAAWAAIDSRRMNVAQRHMESAVTLAGLSGDGQVQHQVWRYASVQAAQTGRWTDAVAAGEAAMSTSIHRRDPLYAAVSHAHLAANLSRTGDRARAMRALERAHVAFSRAAMDEPRPASIAHFTAGELEGLAGITHLRCGRFAEAEAHLHRCVSALRPDQHRNRGYYMLHIASAQLSQGEVEQASATASSVTPPAASPTSGRVPHLMTMFAAQLNRQAPGSTAARYWSERIQPA